MLRSNSNDLTFPVQWLEVTESLVLAKQGDIAQIYRRCNLKPEILQYPDSRINLPQFIELLQIMAEHVKTTTGEPRSLQILRNVPVTVHVMGMAMATADTIADALDIGFRYFPMILPCFTLYREKLDHQMHIHISRHHDFGSTCNDMLTELIAGAFSKLIFFANNNRVLDLGNGCSGMQVHLMHTSTEDAEVFHSDLGMSVKFGCAENQFILTDEALNYPLLTKNHTSHIMLKALLDEQLKCFLQRKSVTLQVRRILSESLSQGKLPDAAEIANLITMSTRTLSRRLNAEGSNLNALIKEVRIEFAELLLISSNLPLSKIAQRLGYSGTTVFSRAFKRAKGKAPSELRSIAE